MTLKDFKFSLCPNSFKCISHQAEEIISQVICIRLKMTPIKIKMTPLCLHITSVENVGYRLYIIASNPQCCIYFECNFRSISKHIDIYSGSPLINFRICASCFSLDTRLLYSRSTIRSNSCQKIG